MKLSKKVTGGVFLGLVVAFGVWLGFLKPDNLQNKVVTESEVGQNKVSASLPSERGQTLSSSRETSRTEPGRFRRSGWDGKAITKKKVRSFSPKQPRLSELMDPSRESEILQFAQGSSRFVSLPGIEAVDREELTDEEKAESLGDFLNYSLLRREVGEGMTGGFQMVYQAEQGTLAVVTGNLQVKFLADLDQGAGLAGKFGMESVSYFPNLRLSFFTTEKRSVGELLQLANQIRKEPGVSEVTLDLIERLPSAQ